MAYQMPIRWLEAITIRMEAITIGMEASAIGMEAIARQYVVLLSMWRRTLGREHCCRERMPARRPPMTSAFPKSRPSVVCYLFGGPSLFNQAFIVTSSMSVACHDGPG